jgi:hypothetical protein
VAVAAVAVIFRVVQPGGDFDVALGSRHTDGISIIGCG